jgi:hypothetical protein
MNRWGGTMMLLEIEAAAKGRKYGKPKCLLDNFKGSGKTD